MVGMHSNWGYKTNKKVNSTETYAKWGYHRYKILTQLRLSEGTTFKYIYWKQRCERPRFGQSPFATFLHESTHPEKNMAALVTSTLHLPQANPKNKFPYTLNSITENRKKQKKQKKTNKPKIPEKGWGLIVAGSLFFFFVFLFVFFFFFFFVFLFFSVFVFLGG